MGRETDTARFEPLIEAFIAQLGEGLISLILFYFGQRRRNILSFPTGELYEQCPTWGRKCPFSVFECIIDDKLLEKMTSKLSKIISEEDSVRIYALCAKCEKVVRVLGRGEITKDIDVFIL